MSARAVPGRFAWLAVTLAASLAATCLDAVLLHLRRAYFTGGFLSVDHITGPAQLAGFFVGSLLADGAVAGVIVAAVLWGAGRLGVRRNVALLAALAGALLPLAMADFAEYQLATYLGDAFDLALMFDLAGRSPGEMLAVSSAHLTRLVVGAAVLAIGCGAAFWIATRALARGPAAPRVSLWRAFLSGAFVLIVGTTVVTAMRMQSDVLDNGLRRKPAGRVLGAVVNVVSDMDRDGAGLLGRPEDPDLFDARIRPYAIDVPGNGIDEDGVGGDLPAGAVPYGEAAAPNAPWRIKPDVIMVVLESVRADAVGASINGRTVTPVLDALVARGISSRHAYSHNGYTVQSRRHLFTGSVADIRGQTTLIDDFHANGYQTAYFSAQDESFGGSAQGIGFERADVAYDARADRARRSSTFSTPGSLSVPFGVVVERVEAFLNARRRGQPLFLYVNFHDTHFPYHHAGVRPLVSDVVLPQAQIGPAGEALLRAMYLNTVSNVDRAIGDVLSAARRSLDRDPAVIVLSDHGESLFDEGFLGHGYALNDVQTRIPLIIANLPVTLEEPAGQADLRDAIHGALAAPSGRDAASALRESRSRVVFQYLGVISRPAQIALTGLDRRVIYDFRERRVRTDDAAWRRPDDLDPDARQRFLTLVRTWERMMLARAAASHGDTPDRDE